MRIADMKISISNLADLENDMKRHEANGDHVTGVISLLSPKDLHGKYFKDIVDKFPEPRPKHLKIEVDDIWDITREVGMVDGRPGIPPTKEMVQQILDFAREQHKEPLGHIVVHCFAGISRSTAAAIAISADYFRGTSELELMQHIWRESPHAIPNDLIVQYADELLGRDGRLIKAANTAKSMFRGRHDYGYV